MDSPKMLYLKNGRLIDGTGDPPLVGAGLLIREGLIERLVPPAEVHLVPGGVEELDVRGQTIMPGLFDMHVHLCYPRMVNGVDTLLWERPENTTIRAAVNAGKLLQGGFTTIRDVGCRGLATLAVRDAIQDGLIEGPRILASGPTLTTTAGLADRYLSWVQNRANSSWTVDGVEEVRKAVRTLLKDGADNIKLEASGGEASPFCRSWDATMSYEEITMAVREAGKAGKTVAAHAQANEAIRNAVRAGVTTLEHASYLDRDTAFAARDQGIFIVPTSACIFSWLEFGPKTGAPLKALHEMGINKDPWIKSIRMAADLGVKIANGSDLGGRFPQGQQGWEFELLVKHIGFTPMEVIVAATKTAAEAARLAERTGTLKPGKLADLLVVDGDPSQDITVLRNLDRIQLIMKEGIVYKNTLEASCGAHERCG